MSIQNFIFTLIRGKKVGEDVYGNRYYTSTKKAGAHIGRRDKARRWVKYNGKVEPSKVPPMWHAWLHYMSDELPTEQEGFEWQKEHLPNLTGTGKNYTPVNTESKTEPKGTYSSWNPNS